MMLDGECLAAIFVVVVVVYACATVLNPAFWSAWRNAKYIDSVNKQLHEDRKKNKHTYSKPKANVSADEEFKNKRNS